MSPLLFKHLGLLRDQKTFKYQETFLIVSVENSCAVNNSLINRKFKRSAFIWKRNLLFNALLSLLNQFNVPFAE